MSQNNIGCDLIRGIELPSCRGPHGYFNRGGIQQLYLIKGLWVDHNGYLFDENDLITQITMLSSQKFKQIELQFETASVNQKEIYDIKTGSIYFDSTINFLVYKDNALNRKLVLELVQSQQLLALYQDNVGRWFLGGKDNYLRAQVDSESTGKNFADFNGYSITLFGQEKYLFYQVDDSVIPGIIETNIIEDCCLFRHNPLSYSQLFSLYDYRLCQVAYCP